jgi:hypothetical protein
MQLRPGLKLHSAVCDAQVVVVRAPAAEVDLGCGGAPMVPDGEAPPAGATLDATLGDPAQLGKRYEEPEVGLELLCTKAGAGALTCNGAPLALKGAKPLPASD